MSKSKVWVFYDEKDNERLAFIGTTKECAEWLNTDVPTLQQSMSKVRHGKTKFIKARYSFVECSCDYEPLKKKED